MPSKNYKLTNTEKEILHLLTDEFLTIKQIALRRQCTLQAVYKIIKKLKKKGIIDIGLNKVEKIRSTPFKKSDIRLHGQEINIRIISQNNKYQKQLRESNILFIDGNTIRLYRDSIEIYLRNSFYGKTVNEAEKKSLDYLERFINRLENDLNIILKKPRAKNIKIVNQHYARGDSEICENAIKNKKRIWIRAEEDGRLCFVTDDSFGFKEDETLHPITSKRDRKAIDKQINDWRINNPPTNSELAEFIKINLIQQRKSTDNINTLLNTQKSLPNVLNRLEQQIKSHLQLIKEYRKENISWRKKKEQEIRKKINQTKLDNFI